jgi:hypothetical protein
VVGVVGLGLCAVGAPFSPAQFFRAYLTAYIFFLGLGLGSLVLLMIYFLTGGAWGFLIRRILEAGMRTLPLLAILFVPIGLGAAHLYLWAQPGMVAIDKNLQYQHFYLNLSYFWGRAILYFILWNLLAFLLDYLSRRQDRAGSSGLSATMARISGLGLAAYGISINFASVDWLMSLQPSFRSTIFGPLFAAGQILSAFAFTLIVMDFLLNQPALARRISNEVLKDLGSLLLTFLIIWAYLEFFQFMLIWIADLRYDAIWLLAQGRNGWQWVAAALCAFGFAVPFFLLLMRSVSENPAVLARVAWLVLGTQLLFVYFQVMPQFPDTHWSEHWMDFLMPLGIGGLWLAFFLWQLKQRSLLPLHDPSQEAALHYREIDLEAAARREELGHG